MDPTPAIPTPAKQDLASPGKSSFLPIFLAILCLFLFATTALFVIQTTKLQQQLTLLEKSLSATPTPTPSTGADTITYTNNVIGFSIDIPRNLKIKSEGSKDSEGKWSIVFSNSDYEITIALFENRSVMIPPFGKSEPLTKNNLFNLCPEEQIKEVTFQERPAIRCVNGININYYILDEKSSFRLWGTTSNVDNVSTDIIDKTLSTFKFTD